MNRTRCLTILIFAATVAPISGGTSQEETNIKELAGLEEVWNKAHVEGDADALNRLWADDFVVTVTNMPFMTKEGALGFFQSGRMKFRRYETSDIRIRAYNDAALVTGRLQRTREVNGREMNDLWRFTKMYVRCDRRWQVVAFHASTSDQ